MKTRVLNVLLAALMVVVFSKAVFAQGAATPAAAPVSTGDPAKLADIRKLIAITGGENLGKQMMEQMIDNFKQANTDIPAEFWTEFLNESDMNSLTEATIPVYDKYLSQDEVKEIIKFYETPTGKKLISVLPQIMQETYAAGIEWGNNVGQKVVDKLKAKGYLDEQGQPVKKGDTDAKPATPAAK